MSLFGDIAKVASSVVNTVENVAGDAAKTAGDVVSGGLDVAGGLANIGQDVMGSLPLPLPLPFCPVNPFEVIKGLGGIAGKLIGDGDGYCGTKPHPLPFPWPGLGGGNKGGGSTGGGDTSAIGDSGGSSILAVLMQLARKERNELFDKVNQLKNLKVPGKDASPQEQADFESTRDELKASIQSLQSEVQTTVTMATNLEKNDHDTEMSIARNLA
jgi:hypothetical protein